MYSIGVDVGGTKIKAGLVDKGKVLREIKVPTQARKGRKHVIDRIIGCINNVSLGVNKKDIKGIGIGVPGSVSNKRDKVLFLTNINCLNNTQLKKIIEDKLGLRVVLGNDSNAFALAESVSGAGKPYNNIVCLTLGTGVGGGVIINNQIYSGKCCAGEIGHMTIIHKGVKCRCGNKGCLEEYVSARAIARYSRKVFGRNIPPLEIENMARKGNKKAIKIYRIVGEYLGTALVNINNILHPDVIIIGGGLSRADYLMLDPAKEILKEKGFFKPTKVVKSKLGSNAGVIGASYLTRPAYLSTL